MSEKLGLEPYNLLEVIIQVQEVVSPTCPTCPTRPTCPTHPTCHTHKYVDSPENEETHLSAIE
ncbi:hypothetical protein RR46_04737 [Papilio xuthus]|uniref:Uncharacterized protein n=1 Tax=Papilio xuthus TaxID=66420 RepID=A0A194Q344_PAPXU|nr:hypothetical protein RR46_04737 [Papilio xuthus]